MHGKHFSLGQAFNTDSGGRGEDAKTRLLRNKMFHTLYQNVAGLSREIRLKYVVRVKG